MSSVRGSVRRVLKNYILLVIINVCGCCVCGVGTCHRVCVEIRGHIYGLGSLHPPVHGIHRLNLGLQACAASAFTCKVILPASVWSFYEDVRNMGSRLRPLFVIFFSPRVLGNCLTIFIRTWGVESPGMGLHLLGKRHSWPSQRIKPLSHPVILFRKQKMSSAPSIHYNAVSNFLLVMFA